MKTIKAFLKILVEVRDQPISYLRGFDKLTHEEFTTIGNVVADIANEMAEDDFQNLLKKHNLK